MASRSRSSSGGRASKIIWFFLVAGLIVAFFQIPYSPGASGVIQILQSKAETVQRWVGGVSDPVTNIIEDIIQGGQEPVNNPGVLPDPAVNPPAYPSADEARTALASIPVADAAGASYNRDDWNHWIDVRPCWSVREQVLATEAVPGSLVMQDSNGNPTADINAACSITSGEWRDLYSGNTYTNPRDLDIDHMVPLNYAHQHGGAGWDNNRRQAYANDLAYDNHLIAVSASENRSKGDQGPGSWRPTNEAAWCTYAQSWISVSTTWGLSATQADVTALDEMLGTC